ncbi:hypothetical protein BJ138DRAFT_1181407 [Hygrophoropsis aurantiaca]|uniref:Uncharacterized protein n=1 Tax=Hygrophoropsis aurantiaca TaxID=72124 RepID=A0ACB8A6R5_9AGAM|nr:hypothetical protein BJ138DRAFT_1181407 [Hygrophoropsis aurantiaca]
MPETSFAQMWTPVFIGLALSMAMYGIALGQYFFYLRAFTFDPKALKVMVLLLFIMDTLHSYGMLVYFRRLLILCHHNTTSAICISVLPWELFMAVILSYLVTFVVQSFYVHRVWIISAHNRWITVTVLVTALAQFVFGMLCTGNAIRTKSVAALYTSMVTGGSAAGMSVACDTVITSSVFYYLHLKRQRVKRASTAIHQLVNVFINMGLFTCLISMVMFITYSIQGSRYLVGTPGQLLCKSYINSILAVLNARKSIRQNATQTFKLSTIPTSTRACDASLGDSD